MNPLVLYVDDDEAQRFSIRQILTAGGYRLLEAASGSDALQVLGRNPNPDLVLLDLRLPDMDGRELFRRMRARKGTATVPVIFLTSARVVSSDRVQALRDGADGCLQIPAAADELRATIRSVLRLRKAEKAARDSASVREHLLALVSHDLKNPLAALTISVQLLKQAAPPGSEGDLVRRHAGIIERSAVRMDRLVTDLADLAWIESGRFVLAREHLLAEMVLREALDAHQGIASASGVVLVATTTAPGLRLFADRHRVSQVLANLISNAIKFSPATATVSVFVETRDGGVTFRVHDAGPGIPEDHREKLFDRFWQAAETAQKGTGLGLSIAKAIVEAHGGTIRVESTPGNGSTFSFTIPG